MKVNELWELPFISQELEDGVQFDVYGMDIIISFIYVQKSNIKVRAGIKFDSVLCHMHTSECFTKNLFNAYDTLVEIKDSEWLEALKTLNGISFLHWKPSHYAIYFDSVGLYQFIATGYQILVEEVI
ncbi:MAG: hypothetical protein PHF63_03265 [Herbinix sp.]|nr:hypothetical protein [Herbinix sp.]